MRARLTALVVLVFAVGLLVPGVASANGVPLDEITESTVLTEDHFGGFVIKAPDVTLNCDGYQILPPVGGPPPDDNFGVLIEGQSGITVKDCRISGFQTGVQVTNAKDTTVKSTVVVAGTGDYEHAFGFTVATNAPQTSEAVSLIENRSSGGSIGFWVVGTAGVTMKENHATGAALSGFALWGTSDSTLSGNEAIGNTGHGFDVCYSSQRNRLTGNLAAFNDHPDAEGPEVHGFQICDGSDSNVLSGNVAERNDIGFLLTNVADNSLIANHARYHREGGFAIVSNTSNTLLVGNDSSFNDDAGFFMVGGVSGNVVMGNTIVGNGNEGVFLAYGSIGNHILENRIRDNQNWGLVAWLDSQANEVRDNKFCHNSPFDVGLYLYPDNKVCGPAG